MSLFLYSERGSLFHGLHPSAKIMGLLLAFVAAMAFSHPLFLLPLALVFVPPGLAAHVGPGLKRVGWLMVIIGIMSFILWGIFYPGSAGPSYPLGPLRLRQPALLYGAGMALRLNLMLYAGLTFLASTRVEEFTAGLLRLGVPYSISFALSLSFRLVPIFTDTAVTILDAQRSRGLDTEADGPRQRLRTYLPLLVPVFASALRRANLLAIALESKGFGSGIPRTSFRQYRFAAADAVFLLLMSALAAGCVTARLLGYGGVA
jgi:energy-coupling factor transport system permease protein